MDATHWQLADSQDVEILNLEDDHSRFFLASVAFPTVKAADVVHVMLGSWRRECRSAEAR
jgi:hypothetical protein